MNPFLLPPSTSSPLREEEVQQIHLEALLKAVKNGTLRETPAHIPLDRLGTLLYKCGPESLMVHPADLEMIFKGVTHAVYQAIDELYCSHLGLSISTTWRVLEAMAKQAQMSSLSYEAIWAICLSFEKRRRDILTVRIEQGTHTWWLGRLTLNCTLQRSVWQNTQVVMPLLWYVVNSSTSQVLACHLAPGEREEEHQAFVLYEALLAQRRPNRNAPFGLIWHLPQRVATSLLLPEGCRRACHALGVGVASQEEPPALIQTLQKTWATSLTGRILSHAECLLLFDTYVAKYFPPGPLRQQQEQEQHYGHLSGYQRDAVWQFPLLRAFLPKRQAMLTEDGVLPFQGLHYHDPLLVYWPNASVTFRFSLTSDTLIWVYLEEEILCQAYARERRPQEERHRATHSGR